MFATAIAMRRLNLENNLLHSLFSLRYSHRIDFGKFVQQNLSHVPSTVLKQWTNQTEFLILWKNEILNKTEVSILFCWMSVNSNVIEFVAGELFVLGHLRLQRGGKRDWWYYRHRFRPICNVVIVGRKLWVCSSVGTRYCGRRNQFGFRSSSFHQICQKPCFLRNFGLRWRYLFR